MLRRGRECERAAVNGVIQLPPAQVRYQSRRRFCRFSSRRDWNFSRVCSRPLARLSLRHSFDAVFGTGNKEGNNSVITFFHPFRDELILSVVERVFEDNNYAANAPLWAFPRARHLFARINYCLRYKVAARLSTPSKLKLRLVASEKRIISA